MASSKIEKKKRTFKTHWCAFEFDNGFVNIKLTHKKEYEDKDKDKDEKEKIKNEVKKEQDNKCTNTAKVSDSATI